MQALFKKKLNSAPGWLVIAPAEGRADLIHLHRTPGGLPRVTLAESVERGDDSTAMLMALRKPLGLARHRCSALLRHGEYQLIQTEAVEGPPEEARESLRWRLKDQVEFPVDNAAIDLLPIPGGGRSPQVFAAIAPESVVAPLIRSFQAAKVPLAAIDLPELSQRNIAALLEEPGRGLALLAFDDVEGLLTFTVDGELLVARHVEISARQIAGADAERRGMFFERIALDIQRSLDNFDRMYSAVPLSRLVVAAIPGVEGFVDYLAGNLTVPVEPLRLEQMLDFGAVPALLDPLRQHQCLRAIGAALRDEGA